MGTLGYRQAMAQEYEPISRLPSTGTNLRNTIMTAAAAMMFVVAAFAVFSNHGNLPAGLPSSLNFVNPTKLDYDYTPLRDVVADLTSGYSVGVGGVVHVKHYLGNEVYDAFVAANYDWLTAENGCKWRYTLSDNPQYWRCDAALEFAEAHNMTFRGHALVWGSEGSNPNWLQPSNDEYGNWTVDEKRTIIVDHIKEFMNRYGSRIVYYDVVNEAVCDCISWTGSKYATCADYVATDSGAEKCGYSTKYNAYLKRNVFWPDVEDYIGLSFTTAREVSEAGGWTAKLGYNEYKFETGAYGGYGTNGGFLKEKGISVYNMTKALIAGDIPIDYIGSQTHIDLSYLSDFDGYIQAVKDYSQSIVALKSGLEWHFTEVTVGTVAATSDYMTTDEQTQQATLYSGLLEACIELGQATCPVFQMWGSADNYTTAYEGLNPYLFDVANQPKLSYYSFVDTLKNATVCVADYANCYSSSGNGACCNNQMQCFQKSAYYAQCRKSCPSGSGWSCESSR